MTNEREQLELAAKAAGIQLNFHGGVPRNTTGADPAMNVFAFPEWNPLTDDGDALRLAVKLSLRIDLFSDNVLVETQKDEFWERRGNDECAATRRAIVLAAAEIGRTME